MQYYKASWGGRSMEQNKSTLSETETRNLRSSKELRSHLTVLDSLTAPALGVLAVASGI